MEFHADCPSCGKEHKSDQPEGKMLAWFMCECGEIFGIAIIIEPYGKAFLYGVEALRRRRYSTACIQFATAFEVFQKQYVEALLKRQGVEPSLVRFMVYDLDLPRDKYSQISRHILHKKLKHPDVSLRNSAVHYGRVPQRAKVIKLAKDVMENVNAWITEAEQITGIDYKRLWEARDNGQQLPQDAAEFDKAIFELRIAYRLMLGEWMSLKKGKANPDA
ncbi:MAG TPA: hypothetical protein VJ866_13210 [Pyrinomonadaceae bacterium]|nr:hypothetical protein [Pyrinomonadaceae bacterium]